MMWLLTSLLWWTLMLCGALYVAAGFGMFFYGVAELIWKHLHTGT